MDFFAHFSAVFGKVGLLFLLIAVGFLCQKVRLLNEEANGAMANLVMYLVTPCVIVNAFSAKLYAREELLGILKNMGAVALAAIAVHVLMIAAVTLVFRFQDEDRRRIMRFACVFSNAGFVALPLAQALIDTNGSFEGALYSAVYLAVFNIALWTWGLVDMQGSGKGLTWQKLVLNPGMIGVAVGLIFFTSPLYMNQGIVLPSVVTDALGAMSALNLPLPMLMVGYYLGKADLLSGLKDRWSYRCIAFRLVVFPLLAFAGLYLCGMRGNPFIVSVIGSCAPVGATTTIFSAKFRNDTALSVKLVSLSTILSLITMPFIIGLASYVA